MKAKPPYFFPKNQPTALTSRSSYNNSAYANFERFINSVDNNKTSISFHSSANYGSGGLDVSDTSRLSSSARAKSKRRSSIFTGRRPSSRRRLKHNNNSSPEDRHAALDDEEGRFMFV